MIIFCPQKLFSFQFLKTLRVLSLIYSAVFRRSRLVFSRRFSSEKCPTIAVASFLVGAFLVKSARLLQWLVFSFFFRQTTISL